MASTTANGITIEYERHGDPTKPTVRLVMGLAAQLTLWPIEFVVALVARGFHVIRYDNRDIGLSTRFDEAGVPDTMAIIPGAALLVIPRMGHDLPVERVETIADGIARVASSGGNP
jgi:alpha-beta hydrolase superfamily lysophospholipase